MPRFGVLGRGTVDNSFQFGQMSNSNMMQELSDDRFSDSVSSSIKSAHDETPLIKTIRSNFPETWLFQIETTK